LTPSKGFLCVCLAILFTLIFQNTSLSDTSLPHQQSFSISKEITIQENPVQTEDQRNPSKALSESPSRADQTIHQSPMKDFGDRSSAEGGSSDIRGLTSDDKPIMLNKLEIPSGEDETPNEEYDMPITLNEVVKKSIDYFKSSTSSRFNMWLNRSGRYLSLMKDILKEEGLPQDLVYLVIIESGFNPYAYSWAKAVGYWQFISSTAKRYGLRINWWVDERRDPVKSTIAAAKYLKDLYDLFGSWNLALAAYNGGEGRVLRGLSKIRGGDFWDLRDTRYIKRETKEYVPRYMAATIIAKNPEGHGFVVDYHESLKYDEVTVESPIDLKVIARCAGTTIEEIKELNPELKRWCTPPDTPTYTIKIPAGTKETFLSNLESIPADERFTGRTYRVKTGETLNKIAKNFGVSTKILREINSLGKGYKAKPGDTLFVPSVESAVLIAKAEKKVPIKKNSKYQKRIAYKVKKGDSLFKIAQRHNISPEKIKEWNGLTDSKLKIGDILYIFTS
jgi:membrane-bound lytic murein transglycosylase D